MKTKQIERNGMVLGALICVLMTLVSCATNSTVTRDPLAGSADPRLATVTVMREPRFTGAAVKVNVELDGQRIGRIGNREGVVIQVPPGRHLIAVTFPDPIGEALNIGSYEKIASLHAEAGKNYYFLYTSQITGPEFRKLSQAEGERELTTRRYALVNP